MSPFFKQYAGRLMTVCLRYACNRFEAEDMIELLRKSLWLIGADATDEFNSLGMLLSPVAIAFRQHSQYLDPANHMFYHYRFHHQPEGLLRYPGQTLKQRRFPVFNIFPKHSSRILYTSLLLILTSARSLLIVLFVKRFVVVFVSFRFPVALFFYVYKFCFVPDVRLFCFSKSYRFCFLSVPGRLFFRCLLFQIGYAKIGSRMR